MAWRSIAILTLILTATCSSAVTFADEQLPVGAMRIGDNEIRAKLAGRTFAFTVFDADKSLTGTSTWDAERRIVFGDYSWDNQSPKAWQREWFIKDDQNCTRPPNKEAECMTIFLHGDNFFEVNPDGSLHAISKPQ